MEKRRCRHLFWLGRVGHASSATSKQTRLLKRELQTTERKHEGSFESLVIVLSLSSEGRASERVRKLFGRQMKTQERGDFGTNDRATD